MVLTKEGRKYDVPFLVDHVRDYVTNESLPIRKINSTTLKKHKLLQPNVFCGTRWAILLFAIYNTKFG
jgi:hypothetical protein